MNAVDSNIESMSLEDIMGVLEEHIKIWGLPTRAVRREKRLSSTFEELQHFYTSTLPFMPRIIEQLNEHPVKAIPAKYKSLVYTTFALMEVDFPVHKYKKVQLDEMSNPRGVIAKRSYHDLRLLFDVIQEWQNQVNYRDDNDGITLI